MNSLLSKQLIAILIIVFAVMLFNLPTYGKTALLRFGNDDGTKTPLILIHGIHGTPEKQSVDTHGQYWQSFVDLYVKDRQSNGLYDKYAVYLFQYESDVDSAYTIAVELGKAIDRQIPNRPRVILAHSMGGLIAKYFMVFYKHSPGKWQGKTGGETTLGLIALATPHHGTPGANDAKALDKYFEPQYKSDFKLINFIYWQGEFDWRKTLNSINPIAVSSDTPNRSDLRWDNYDSKLSFDVNKELFEVNQRFGKYDDKSILYAGILKPIKPVLTHNTITDDHSKLSFADGMLYYGLKQEFGYTDGLVPYKSSLLCQSSTGDFECDTPYRVRRFEFNNSQIINVKNNKTLSITRTARGFDHKDMYEHSSVLNYVREDLLKFLDSGIVQQPKPINFVIPEIPTLFLMDVSGSMNDNGKINQAKDAAINAVGEMKSNRQRGQDNSSVSVWTFGGECSPNNIKSLMPFSNDLNRAENIFRRGIPRPDGSTPLYTAIDLSVDQMMNYLTSRSHLQEARIVVLTDGDNTCDNQIRPRGVYSQSRNIVYKKVRFYCIGFNISPGSKEERDLQYLASASGGKYFPARDGGQLNRIFQKIIRVYVPKVSTNGQTNEGTQAILNKDFENALQIWTIYVKNNPTDAVGYYNLALVCEATERYKCAVENYGKYLQLSTNLSDTTEIETRIKKLEEDYRIKILYYLDVMRSDLDYLKEYYKRLFGLKNDELATEFAGFVAEKGVFYRNLEDTLEVRSSRIKRSSTDLADSLDFLNRRVGLASFDRDAVSLLTMPISHLEDLIKQIEALGNNKIRNL